MQHHLPKAHERDNEQQLQAAIISKQRMAAGQAACILEPVSVEAISLIVVVKELASRNDAWPNTAVDQL